MAYRQRMSDLLEQVRNPQIKESGPSDYLKSKMSDTQINNIKKTWAMKTAKDVTPAIRKMIKDLDIPTQLAIKHANINVISKLVEEGDHEISMAQGELKAISAKATELANMLSTKSDDTDELEAWVQSKITKAKDYISSVSDYLTHNPGQENEGFVRESFNDAQIAKLKKEYEPMRGKTISITNANKLGAMFTRFDKDKNALEKLYGGDIPFISTMAMTRLMTKHNYKAADLNKIRKEDIDFNELEILDEATQDYLEITEGAIDSKKFDSLKRGDTLTITYNSTMAGSTKQKFVVKSKSRSAKYNTDKVTMYPDGKPNMARYFLYKRANGDVSMALGDMAASMMKVEEVSEGRMSEIDAMVKAGKSAAEIAKELKLNVRDVKAILGEQLTEEEDAEKLKSELEKKDDEIARLKQKAETDKAKVAKKETEKLVNPETGEPLLQVGVAYKHLKDKMAKEKAAEQDRKEKKAADMKDKVAKIKDKLKESFLNESDASDQAKKMGLDYMKFGRYGKDGKVTHVSKGGRLTPADKDGKPTGDPIDPDDTPKTTGDKDIDKVNQSLAKRRADDKKKEPKEPEPKPQIDKFDAQKDLEGLVTDGMIDVEDDGEGGLSMNKEYEPSQDYDVENDAIAIKDYLMDKGIDEDDIYVDVEGGEDDEYLQLNVQVRGKKEAKEETIVEFTSQQIKMAYGILNDPRYKQGNYSGAVKAIEKLAKGLSKHPDVANALKRANESLDEMAKDKAYAIGMSTAKKKYNDEPPLDKKTIKKGHEIADKLMGMKKEETIKEFKKMTVTFKTMDKMAKASTDLAKHGFTIHAKGLVMKVDGKGDDLNKYATDLKNFYGATVKAEENAPTLSDLERMKKAGMKPKKEETQHDLAKMKFEQIAALKKKSDKSGMPYSILKKVYDRGMAAWKGGHRPGASQHQWAFARVNSFVTKSSGTWGGADKDLAAKVKGE